MRQRDSTGEQGLGGNFIVDAAAATPQGGKGWGMWGNFISVALSYRPPPPPHCRRHTAKLLPPHREIRGVGRRKVYFRGRHHPCVCVGGWVGGWGVGAKGPPTNFLFA